MHAKYQVSIFTGSKFMAITLYFTFDLEGWHWPWQSTTKCDFC